MGGTWRPMRSRLWTQTNIYEFLNVIYLFEAIWGVNHLDFTGFNKIYPDFASLGAFLAGLGALVWKIYQFKAQHIWSNLVCPKTLLWKLKSFIYLWGEQIYGILWKIGSHLGFMQIRQIPAMGFFGTFNIVLGRLFKDGLWWKKFFFNFF